MIGGRSEEIQIGEGKGRRSSNEGDIKEYISMLVGDMGMRDVMVICPSVRSSRGQENA